MPPLTADLLATNGPALGIMDAGNNISPRLRKQLVLELEVGVEVTKILEGFPSRVLLGHRDGPTGYAGWATAYPRVRQL